MKFLNGIWCLQIYQKTNEIFLRISALASKNKHTLYHLLDNLIFTILHYFFFRFDVLLEASAETF